MTKATKLQSTAATFLQGSVHHLAELFYPSDSIQTSNIFNLLIEKSSDDQWTHFLNSLKIARARTVQANHKKKDYETKSNKYQLLSALTEHSHKHDEVTQWLSSLNSDSAENPEAYRTRLNILRFKNPHLMTDLALLAEHDGTFYAAVKITVVEIMLELLKDDASAELLVHSLALVRKSLEIALLFHEFDGFTDLDGGSSSSASSSLTENQLSAAIAVKIKEIDALLVELPKTLSLRYKDDIFDARSKCRNTLALVEPQRIKYRRGSAPATFWSNVAASLGLSDASEPDFIDKKGGQGRRRSLAHISHNESSHFGKGLGVSSAKAAREASSKGLSVVKE